MASERLNSFSQRIKSVRSFNRFYTKQIGLLNEGVYDSPFSLTEVRVLYELSTRGETIATTLRLELGLDAGYLSRILRRFERRGLIRRRVSPGDRRQSLVSLTVRGRQAFTPLDRRSDAQVASMLRQLDVSDQKRLVQAMTLIKRYCS